MNILDELNKYKGVFTNKKVKTEPEEIKSGILDELNKFRGMFKRYTPSESASKFVESQIGKYRKDPINQKVDNIVEHVMLGEDIKSIAELSPKKTDFPTENLSQLYSPFTGLTNWKQGIETSKGYEQLPFDIRMKGYGEKFGVREDLPLSEKTLDRPSVGLVGTPYKGDVRPSVLDYYGQMLVEPLKRATGNIKNLDDNPVANTIGLVTNIGHTILSPFSTSFAVLTDAIKEYVPSVDLGNGISVGGKEFAEAVNYPFELLANIPIEGAKQLDKILPEKLAKLGTDNQTIQEITQNIQDLTSLVSILVGLKLAHTGYKRTQKPTLEELNELGRRALANINKRPINKAVELEIDKIKTKQVENLDIQKKILPIEEKTLEGTITLEELAESKKSIKSTKKSTDIEIPEGYQIKEAGKESVIITDPQGEQIVEGIKKFASEKEIRDYYHNKIKKLDDKKRAPYDYQDEILELSIEMDKVLKEFKKQEKTKPLPEIPQGIVGKTVTSGGEKFRAVTDKNSIGGVKYEKFENNKWIKTNEIDNNAALRAKENVKKQLSQLGLEAKPKTETKQSVISIPKVEKPVEKGKNITIENTKELTNDIGGSGYITSKTDLDALKNKYGEFSLVVKDANGHRAKMNVSDFQILKDIPEFSDRIRDVFLSAKDASTLLRPEFQKGFMSNKFENIIESRYKENLLPPQKIAEPIEGLEVERNSTITINKQKEFVSVFSDENIRGLLEDLGIKKIIVEKPGKMELSENANINMKSKTITVNADATDIKDAVLHELGHQKFEGLPKEEQNVLLHRVKNRKDLGYAQGESRDLLIERIANNFYRGENLNKYLDSYFNRSKSLPYESEGISKVEKPVEKPALSDIRKDKFLEGKTENLNKLISEGWKPIAKDVKDKAAISKLEKEISILKREAPIGNENHPDTIRLRELQKQLEAGITKKSYRLEKGDTIREISKTEYDYLDKKRQGVEKPIEPSTIEKPAYFARKQALYKFLVNKDKYDIVEIIKQTGHEAKDVIKTLNDYRRQGLIKKEGKNYIPTEEFKTIVDDIAKNPEKYNTDYGKLYSNPIPQLIRGIGQAQTIIDNAWKNFVGDKIFRGLSKGAQKALPEKFKKEFITNYGLPEEYVFLKREMRDAISRYRDLATELGKSLTKDKKGKYSNAEQIRLQQIIRGGITYNKEFKNKVDKVVKEIKELEVLGKELETLPIETYNTKLPRKRIGELLKEKSKLKLKYYEMTERGVKGLQVKILEERINNLDLKVKNSFKHGGEGYFKRIYLTKEQEGRLSKYGYYKPTRLDLTSALRRKDIPPEIRKEMGEILTAAYPVTKSIILEGKDVSLARFFDVVSENLDWVDVKPREGFVQMPNDLKLGKLSNQFVKEEIYNDINDVIRLTSENYKKNFLKGLNGIWKATKTIMNPSTHMRNIYSNTILLDFSGVPHTEQIRILPEAIQAIRGTGKYGRDFKATGLNKTTFTQSELNTFLDVLQDNKKFLDMNLPEKILKAYGKISLVDTKIGRFMGKVYQMEEILAKSIKFINEREKGRSISDAKKEANKWLFDYEEIPPIVRKLRESPVFGIPFVTWMYKAAPRIIESAITRPIAFWKYPLIFSAIAKYSLDQLNLTDEEWENIQKDLPERLVKGQWLLMPFRDDNSKIQMLDLTYILPYKDVYDLMESSYMIATEGKINTGDDIADGIAGLAQSPILKTIAEIMANKNLYNNTPIWRDVDASTEKAKKAFDHIYKTFMPSLAPEIPGISKGGYSYHKLASVIGKTKDYYDRTFGLVPAIGSSLLGVKTSPIEPSKNIENKKYKIDKELIQLGSKVNSILRDGSLNEDEKIKESTELISRMDELRSEKSQLKLPEPSMEERILEKTINQLEYQIGQTKIGSPIRKILQDELIKTKLKLYKIEQK